MTYSKAHKRSILTATFPLTSEGKMRALNSLHGFYK